MDAQTIIAAGTGLAGGSVSVGWIAKILISRYISRRDKLDDDFSLSLKEISKQLSSLETSQRVIEARIAETINIRKDVQDNGKILAVHEEKIQRNSKDISDGFCSVRQRFAKLES